MLVASRDASEMERAVGGCLSLTVSAKVQLGAAPLCVADTNQWCVFYVAILGRLTPFGGRRALLLQKHNKKLS